MCPRARRTSRGKSRWLVSPTTVERATRSGATTIWPPRIAPRAASNSSFAARELTPADHRVVTETPEPAQRVAKGDVERCVWLLPEEGHELAVVESERRAPEVTHLEHLAKRFDERCQEVDREPGEAADGRFGYAGHTARRFGDGDAALEPVASEVKHVERSKI